MARVQFGTHIGGHPDVFWGSLITRVEIGRDTLKNSASFIPSDTQSLKEAAYNLGQFFLKEMPLFLA